MHSIFLHTEVNWRMGSLRYFSFSGCCCKREAWAHLSMADILNQEYSKMKPKALEQTQSLCSLRTSSCHILRNVTHGIISDTLSIEKYRPYNIMLSYHSFCLNFFLIKIALLDLFRQWVLLYLLFIHHNKGCMENKFKCVSKPLHTLLGSVTHSRADRSRFSYTLSFAVPIRPPPMHF